uniref:Uncharacterized protein n=1 Tax=Myoviridae sp. ct2cn10 TaxID=2825022 RepID=A0A8S5PAF2_9CAUD|nr:MAG TPA: hypothetical protein [Myoviridae sp. ct2cn10]
MLIFQSFPYNHVLSIIQLYYIPYVNTNQRKGQNISKINYK